MRPRKPINAPGIRHAVAPVSALKAAGVARWRLYTADVPRVFHGIAVAPGTDPETFESKVAGLRQLMSAGRFISRHTAARLYGLPVDTAAGAVEAGSIQSLIPLRRTGIRSHQVRPDVFSVLPAAPDWLPAPAEVWGLLAATDSVEQLVVVGDHLISGPNRAAAPLCDVAELEEVVQRFSGCAGVSQLRIALPLLRTGVESPAESQTRLLIVRAGLPEPRTCCEVAVFGRVFHSDLGYPELQIAIEYEGEYHFSGGLEQARKDSARHEAMRDAGWTVLIVTAIDLRDPREFLRRLERAILAARSKLS